MNTEAEIRDNLIAEMQSVFGSDQKRIKHAMEVLNFADQINAECRADCTIVTAAAILHDIGIQRAEKKHNSNAGKYQEIEGPPIAKEILTRLGIEPDAIDHICRIIANHHSAKDKATANTKEFKVIWDSDWLVNFADIYPDISDNRKTELIEKIFKTQKGYQLGQEHL